VPDFESAIETTKKSSLRVAREAGRVGITKSGISWTFGDLLHAFGGLRYPKSGYVAQLGYLVRENWRVEAACPSCEKTMLAEIRENGVSTFVLDSGGYPDSETSKLALIDRSGYSVVIAKGKAILACENADWRLEDTPNVLSALAEELGDTLLATRILDLGTTVTCAYCCQTFQLSNGLHPL